MDFFKKMETLELYKVIEKYDIDSQYRSRYPYGFIFISFDKVNPNRLSSPMQNIHGKYKHILQVNDVVLLEYNLLEIQINDIVDGENLIARKWNSMYNKLTKSNF